MSEDDANPEGIGPADLAEEMGEAGAEAIDEDAGSGGGSMGSITDGLMSAEPDIAPGDTSGLLDTTHGPKAHFEVGIRKFMAGYGIEGVPAVVHIAVAAFSMAQAQMDASNQEADTDDSGGFSDIDVQEDSAP